MGSECSHHCAIPAHQSENANTYSLIYRKVVSPVMKKKKQNKAEPSYRTGAHFLKVSKLFGGISSDIILFVSSKQRHLEAQNSAVILIFISFTTYEKTSFTEQVGCSFANSFSDPKRFCNFQETGLWTLNNCHCQPV